MESNEELNKKLLPLNDSEKFVELKKECEKILEREPTNEIAMFFMTNALLGLADTYMELTDSSLKQALDYCNKLLIRYPNDHNVLANKADALRDLGHQDQSLEFYDKAIKEDPSDHLLFASKAIALRDLGRINEAIELCNKALSMEPNDPDVLELLEELKGN